MAGGAAGAIDGNGFVATENGPGIIEEREKKGVEDALLPAAAMPLERAAFDIADDLVGREGGEVFAGEGAEPCCVEVGMGAEKGVGIICYIE